MTEKLNIDGLEAIKDYGAESVPEIPDELTQQNITEDRKARTAAVRADDLESATIETLRSQVSWLKRQIDLKDERIADLERVSSTHSLTLAELAKYKSPATLRRRTLRWGALLGAVGTAAVLMYPQHSTKTLLGVSSASVFGCGVSFILLAAVLSFVMGSDV